MKRFPLTWMEWFFKKTNFIKTNSRSAVLVLLFLYLPSVINACVLICKNNLSVSLSASGEATLTPSILLEDPSCDPNNFYVDIYDPNSNPIGNTITCDYIGLSLIARVIENNSGNYCTTNINVTDYISPQINCTDTVLYCNQSVDPSVTGYPMATDNCSVFANSDLSYSDEFTDLDCFTEVGTDTITAQIQRTWSVQDESGNTSTCIQMIYLKRSTIDDIVFPANLNGFDNPALDCGQDPMDLSITGEPLINGLPIEVSGSCELVVTFSDQIAPLCGTTTGAYRILRTWQVVDYCSGDFLLSVQIINLEDNTVPQIICPSDITVSTSQNDCTATVNLNAANASDDCSELTISTDWVYGTGQGPFIDIPIGTHAVTYTATDDCGNAASCIAHVIVIDAVPPTPVCNTALTLSLSSEGEVALPATTLDNGSFDNCSLDYVQVSRDGLFYGAQAAFDCNDIGQGPIPVTLRVWDVAGNQNECTVSVNIEDKMAPAISCPPNKTLDCTSNHTNLSLAGEPIAIDNCSNILPQFVDSADLNICNTGTVWRTWTISDESGNTSACLQTIYLVDTLELLIEWPENFLTDLCEANLDPIITGEPELTNSNCKQTYITHHDEYFYISSSCYRILRTWTVYEWCTYDGNGAGEWSTIQVIDVEDNTAPIITCASDTIFSAFANNCENIFISLEAPDSDDCNPDVVISNNSAYANANGADASGFYPNGTHLIHYEVSDECGNTSSCTRTIQVVDAKLPTPVCIGGINVNLGQSGVANIDASMIDYGSYDNCTIEDNLIRTLSPSNFDCNSIGVQEVTLTITDEVGNSAFCTTIVDVQDNAFVCSTASAMITGSITNLSNTPLVGVQLLLSGAVEDTLWTDENGVYTFPDLPMGNHFTISPYKNSEPTNGVTTYDIVLMQRHILGLQTLDTPYKRIAADVNNSGSISTFDLVRLRRLILLLDTVMINNTSWRYVEEDFVFADPTNPWSSVFPESFTINNLSSDELNANFIGIKVGDINNSANTSEWGGGEINARSNEPLHLWTPEHTFTRGDTISLPIYAKEQSNLLGFQFALEFEDNHISFIDFEPAQLEVNRENFNLNNITDGILNMSWSKGIGVDLEEARPLFVFKFKALSNGSIKDIIRINQKKILAEAYTDNLEIRSIDFGISEEKSVKEVQFMLYQNYPNPVVDQTVFIYELDEQLQGELRISDIAGEVIWQEFFNSAAGKYKRRLDRKSFPSSGIYFLSIRVDGGEQRTIKMLVQ